MTYTIVFDLDGTLIHTAPDLWAAMNRALEEDGMKTVPFHAINGLVGQGALVMLRRGLAYNGASIGEQTVKKLHGRFLELYEENIAEISTPYEGCLDALDHLADAGHRLAVCTNKYERMAKLLFEKLGMTDRFAFVSGPETFGIRKPDPEHILKTVDAVGGDRSRAIMVGDSRADIEAAKAGNVPVVAVSFGYTDIPVAQLGPDVVIDHYNELIPALETLMTHE